MTSSRSPAHSEKPGADPDQEGSWGRNSLGGLSPQRSWDWLRSLQTGPNSSAESISAHPSFSSWLHPGVVVPQTQGSCLEMLFLQKVYLLEESDAKSQPSYPSPGNTSTRQPQLGGQVICTGPGRSVFSLVIGCNIVYWLSSLGDHPTQSQGSLCRRGHKSHRCP